MRFQKTFTRALSGGTGTLGGDGTLGTAPVVNAASPATNANGKVVTAVDADNFISLGAVSNQGWPGHRVGIGYLGPATAANLNCEVWFFEKSTNAFFKLEAAKALTYKTAEAYNDEKHVKKQPLSFETVKLISMAKVFCGELGTKVIDQCMQFHGGAGYIEEYPIARAFRDQRLLRIGGGTTETMRYYIAKLMGL